MFESQLIQMPSPRDIIIYWPGLRAFSVVQKPQGWAHILVQKPRDAWGMVTGQINTCIKRIDILSGSMEADMFAKVKRIDILSRSMEADMFAKVKIGVIYLFYFVVSIGIAIYPIIMNVVLVIKATEWYFIYFITSELMFLASYSFHFMV